MRVEHEDISVLDSWHNAIQTAPLEAAFGYSAFPAIGMEAHGIAVFLQLGDGRFANG